MNRLNENSYAVYIIHLVVLGVIALVMVPLQLPALVKFLLLTVLTFAVSNALVYAYDRLLQQRLILKMAAAASMIVTFFVVTGSGSQGTTAPRPSETVHSVEARPDADISLHEAVIRGDVEAVRRHIKAGTDLDEREPGNGSSPLITAAAFGKTEIAILLIENGADLNLQNNEGSTALITAAFFGRVEIVKALLNHGADHQIRNKSGSTALDAVSAPFETVKEVYDYFQQSLAPLGLQLDYEKLRRDRPRIAEMLRKQG